MCADISSIASAFKLNPSRFLWFYDGSPYNWTEALSVYRKELVPLCIFEDIYVESSTGSGVSIAYIQGMTLSPNKDIAYIRHFAVSQEFCKTGVAQALARELQHALFRNFGTKTIRFCEAHPKFVKWKYPRFFQGLGAVPDPEDGHVWIWTHA